MSHNEIFDVIVVGAGPAGLSVASELSESLKVLIIDGKKELSDTTKSWFIPSFLLDNIPELQQFAYNGVKRYITDTFGGENTVWNAQLNGGYTYIKEHEILTYWGQKVKEHNSTVILDCLLLDHEVSNSFVTISTSKGNYKGKLLIDASGHDSMIGKKYELKNNYYWWSIYGCIAEHPEGLGDMKVGDYMFWGTYKDTNLNPNTALRYGRPVFEYEILTENTSFPLILYLMKEKVPQDVMEKQFAHILHNEQSTEAFHNVNIKELKYGWYPSGNLSQKIAENRVVFIGDAGCWTTPCGWGFGFILKNYHTYAQHIIQAIQKNTLDKESLESIIKLKVHEKHEILMNSLATHFLSNASTNQLDRFIEFFNKTNTLWCEKMFTLTITHKDLSKLFREFVKHFKISELVHIIPKEDIPLILEEAWYFTKDWIIEKFQSVISKFKKDKSDSSTQNGFDFD